MPSPRCWRLEPWDISLGAEQAAHIRHLSEELQHAMASLPCAWLVLDGWKDNPVGAWLETRYPAWVDERQTLPDPMLHGLDGWAPCLLPLHLLPAHEPDADRRQDLVHDVLGKMWLDAQRRLVRQHACGVVFTDSAIDDVLAHWLLLGRQVATDEPEPFAFRHFDPRVLQAVWPRLDDDQRHTVLGPLHQVWQLRAAWGPWAEQDIAIHQDELVGDGPPWQVMCRPGSAAPTLRPHSVMTAALRRLAHQGACGNHVWLTLALTGHALHDQPTVLQMTQLLAQAQQWGFTQAQQWQDWVLLTWQGADARDGAALDLPAIRWHEAPWLEVAGRMKALLVQRPAMGVPELLDLSRAATPAE